MACNPTHACMQPHIHVDVHVPSLQPHVPSLQPYVRPGLSEMFAEQKRRACLLVRAC